MSSSLDELGSKISADIQAVNEAMQQVEASKSTWGSWRLKGCHESLRRRDRSVDQAKHFKETVRAVAMGHQQTAGGLMSQIDGGDASRAYFIYVSAFFAGLAEHWFAEDQSQAAVSRFVNEMRQDFAQADPPIKPLVIEGLIRALFGEDHMLDEISDADQLAMTHRIIRKMVDQSPHIQEHLSQYLEDARLLAEAWTTEAG